MVIIWDFPNFQSFLSLVLLIKKWTSFVVAFCVAKYGNHCLLSYSLLFFLCLSLLALSLVLSAWIRIKLAQALCKWNFLPLLMGLSRCLLFWMVRDGAVKPAAKQNKKIFLKGGGGWWVTGSKIRYLWKWLYHFPHVPYGCMSRTHGKLEVIPSSLAHV